MRSNELTLSPGVYDALSARLAEAAGFRLGYLTSLGVSLACMCKPDIGLITLSELVRQAKYICEAVDMPIIADGEAGFGNPINAIRLASELERLGVSGVDIQDQRVPMIHYLNQNQKELVPIQEHVNKIRAVVEARKSRGFLVIGRTESSDSHEAIKRLRAYSKAGADLVFPHSSWSTSELVKIASATEAPMIVNYPLVRFENRNSTVSELKNRWFRIVLFPVSALFASINAQIAVLEKIRGRGTDAGSDMASFGCVDRLVDRPRFRELEKMYMRLSRRGDR